MPALVNIRVGSFLITIGAEGYDLMVFLFKKTEGMRCVSLLNSSDIISELFE